MIIKELEAQIKQLKLQLKQEENKIIDHMLEHGLTECCLIEGYVAHLKPKKRAVATECPKMNAQLDYLISAKVSANKKKIRAAQARVIKAQAALDELITSPSIVKLKSEIELNRRNSRSLDNSCYNLKVSRN